MEILLCSQCWPQTCDPTAPASRVHGPIRLAKHQFLFRFTNRMYTEFHMYIWHMQFIYPLIFAGRFMFQHMYEMTAKSKPELIFNGRIKTGTPQGL